MIGYNPFFLPDQLFYISSVHPPNPKRIPVMSNTSRRGKYRYEVTRVISWEKSKEAQTGGIVR